jgi:DNA-binding response OmpR family regulator
METACRQILIVDSQTAVLDALGAVLQAAGAQVFIAKNARCARSLLRHGLDPQLVVVNGAGWDRVGELRRLAADPALADVPVLVVTGTHSASADALGPPPP